MMKYTAVLAALLVVAIAAPANAGIDEGDWEVRLSAAAQFEDFSSAYSITTQLGYFVTPDIAVGAEIGFATIDPDVGGSLTTWELNAFASYNFETDGEWVPYVGGFLGLLDLDVVDSFHFGAFIGAKFFVHEKANVFFEYRFDYRTDDAFSDADAELGHGLRIGFAILF